MSSALYAVSGAGEGQLPGTRELHKLWLDALQHFLALQLFVAVESCLEVGSENVRLPCIWEPASCDVSRTFAGHNLQLNQIVAELISVRDGQFSKPAVSFVPAHSSDLGIAIVKAAGILPVSDSNHVVFDVIPEDEIRASFLAALPNGWSCHFPQASDSVTGVIDILILAGGNRTFEEQWRSAEHWIPNLRTGSWVGGWGFGPESYDTMLLAYFLASQLQGNLGTTLTIMLTERSVWGIRLAAPR
eukprot:gnl/MRDRNA2_/MRDRNA2_327683_c0_seq1.p1 gnl/MRDRNA2_/MRDRNA2_327683_c0~~gnl/MRDRNA2_/MRDRNA2_327683_c0_seq1.p1  ORF type:complete len:245 (-),score=34.23 gnl/MRDRNA2_/MRDRNA2_327683_c0_seq1:55-789(-)